MFYRCTKVQHKPINIQVRDPIQRSKRNQVCCGLAHRTVSGAPGLYRTEPATLGFQQAHYAIIHRTVRCATELSGVPAEQQLTRATVDCKSALTAQQWRTVCGRVRGGPDSEQDLSGATRRQRRQRSTAHEP
jgi:hypothetical protein